jgi:hypothetical protein
VGLDKKGSRRGFCNLYVFIILVAGTVVSTGTAYTQQASAESSPDMRSQDGSLRRSWQLGGFFAGGFAPHYWVHGNSGIARSVELNLYNAGFAGGKVLTSFYGPSLLRGRAEAVVEIMPFWLGDYPKQTQTLCFSATDCNWVTRWGPYQRHGVSVTPALVRWNFTKIETNRIVPWAQLGGGVLWTNHTFPLLSGKTGNINFTPQVGIGESSFVRRNQSLDFGVKAVYITNAGLGESGTGVNVTLQFGVGYSWWK